MDLLEDSLEENSSIGDLDPDDESNLHQQNVKPRVPQDKHLQLEKSTDQDVNVYKHEEEVEERREFGGYRSKSIDQPHEANIKSFPDNENLEQDSTTESDESHDIILTRRDPKDDDI